MVNKSGTSRQLTAKTLRQQSVIRDGGETASILAFTLASPVEERFRLANPCAGLTEFKLFEEGAAIAGRLQTTQPLTD